MVFRLVVTAAAGAIALCQTAVVAQECGTKGSPDILQFVGWQASAGDYGVTVTMSYRSIADAPIRMIDGSIWFTDALGGSVGGWSVDRDLHIAPGQEVTQKFLTRDRFADAANEDILGLACVKAVLFEDGTKAEF